MMAGDLRTRLPAMSDTASSSWGSEASTRFIRPSSYIRAALHRSPSSSISSKTLRGRFRASTAWIIAGQTPTLISGVPKVADSTASRMSHAQARPKPPASAWPLMRPTIGLPRFCISRNRSTKRLRSWCRSISDTGAENDPRSAPAQNARSPAPVRTTTRTSRSSRHQANAARRSRSMPADSGLRCSGRFSVTVATRSRTSTSATSRAGTSGTAIMLTAAGDRRPAYNLATMPSVIPKPSVYWLLVFVPLSFVAEFAFHQPVLVFVLACLAIVPLAGLIGRATDQLAIHAGPRVGGLLNATFGNITELIIAILLVRAQQFDVVKASLIGSILSNLLLVLGASYLAGGLRFTEQRFSARAVAVHSSSLLLAVAGLLMPAVFVLSAPDTAVQPEVVSITVAAVLLVVYGAALLFTLVTHTHIFGAAPAPERAEWSASQALAVLLAAAVLVGVESEFLVGSLEPTVAALGLSKLFVGLFVVAIIGNAAEHASAVLFALRNKMELSIEIAFGSSTQIALLVEPLLVFVSLSIGPPMDFVFSTLEVVAVALATLIVSVISLDGRSNWLEGLELLAVYVILGVSFFYVGSP